MTVPTPHHNHGAMVRQLHRHPGPDFLHHEMMLWARSELCPSMSPVPLPSSSRAPIPGEWSPGLGSGVRRPARAALDAVTVSWTIGSEEDGPLLNQASGQMIHHDLRASGGGPVCARAGLPRLSPRR
jgi:hypothetical protein